MSEVLSKFICFLIMALTGYFIIKKISKSTTKIYELRSILVLLGMTLFQTSIYEVQYTITFTIIIFLLNIISFKILFKLQLEDSTLACGIFTLILFFADTIVSTVYRTTFSIDQMRSNPLISILVNLSTAILSLGVIALPQVKNRVLTFYNNYKKKKTIATMTYIILTIFSLCYIGHYATKIKVTNLDYYIAIILIILLSIITYIFIKGRINYNQLTEEYDALFNYIQNFEEWIEKEQLNRHEYKNQLAVIRSITKDKKVIKKIDEILEDNIDIKDEVIHKLKDLPKGGIKGLMYYKVALAQKQKLNVEIDVSLKAKSIINRLNESQVRVLCKLIGIYLDNAIEAALETKEKIISIEVYQLKNINKIVISNTFKQQDNFENRNEKGISTKGKNRGNGLYFANNLLGKHNWIEGKQEITDNLYIQSIIIKELD